MTLVVLLGGARAGKSALAVELAQRAGEVVTCVATAEARDEEMTRRIARHRLERPSSWTTIEEPLELRSALSRVDGVAVVDCLTLWVANVLARGDSEADVVDEANAIAALEAERDAMTIVVSNEVGLGVVPATSLGRVYRDVLSAVNRAFVARSTAAALVVAGRPLPLETLEWPRNV